MDKALLLIVGLALFSFTKNEVKQDNTPINVSNHSVNSETNSEKDLEEIKELIRDVYTWHDQGNPTRVNIMLDTVDSTYSIVNLFELDLASEELVSSNYFTRRFIENHEDIHNAMDEKLKNGDIEWKPGSLPNFGSHTEPWCNCQDVPYDKPNPWSELEIETINLTDYSGEFNWKWGNVDPASDWGEFRYYFKVEKERGQWKIDYLEGLNADVFLRKH